MEASDSPVEGPGTNSSGRPPEGRGEEVAGPVTYLGARARLRPALLGIVIALIATAACAAVGLLLASAIFGSTGGIL